MQNAILQRRKEKDILRLKTKYIVNDDDHQQLIVNLPGPKDSLYENAIWKVGILFPDQYPYKSPSIGFLNKIYHPNVDESSGSICLDVINQTWSPMYDLLNIFDIFLPQLLLYPNPQDPLNPEAASMLIKYPDRYQKKVKDYVQKYAYSDLSRKISEASTKADIEEFDEKLSEISEQSQLSETSDLISDF